MAMQAKGLYSWVAAEVEQERTEVIRVRRLLSGASIYDEKIFSPILVCISFFTHVFTTHNILKKLAKNNDANARKKCVKPYTEFDPAWQGSLPTHCHSASYRKILGQRREFLYFLLPKVDMHVNKQVLELL